MILNDIIGLILLRLLLGCIIENVFLNVVSRWNVLVIDFSKYCSDCLFKTIKRFKCFGVKARLEEEEEKIRREIYKSLKSNPDHKPQIKLPEKGWDHNQIIKELEKNSDNERVNYELGKISGTVYDSDQTHISLLQSVYNLYTTSNPLHVDIWPSLVQMEAEVASMTASLLNGGDENVVGGVTSGGTESIFLAIRATVRYL